MHRTPVWLAATLALLTLTPTASAVVESSPSVYKLSKGTQISPDPIAELDVEDTDYMEVEARRKKVVYKTTHEGLPTTGGSFGITVIAHTLFAPCDMQLSAYKWRSGRFKKWGGPQIVSVQDVTDSTVKASQEGKGFVNRAGKFRVKISCVGDEAFNLKTDIVTVAGP